MLKPEQYITIQYLAQPRNGGLTQEEIAEKCGVSRQTLYKWRQSEEFQNELRKEIRRNAMDKLPEVIDAMVESAVKLKSAAAAKLILQATGMLVEKIEIEKKDEKRLPDLEELKRMIAEIDENE